MLKRVSLLGGVELSRIVYGTARLLHDPDHSPDRIRAKVEACLAQGITTIDHADIYGGGESELIFGRALHSSNLRQQIEIVTKCGIVPAKGATSKHYNTSAAYILASVDRSLRRLCVEHIDMLLIHRPDPLMNQHETGAALDRLVESGKVRSVGVSNFRPWDHSLLQSAMATRLVTNQMEISLAAPGAFSNGDLAYFQEKGMPLMAWSPLGGGRLTERGGDVLAIAMDEIARKQHASRADVALAWLLAHPAQIMPVIGTNNLSRINELADSQRVQLDRAAWFRLYAAACGHEVP